jgi:hypothetical protein
MFTVAPIVTDCCLHVLSIVERRKGSLFTATEKDSGPSKPDAATCNGRKNKRNARIAGGSQICERL